MLREDRSRFEVGDVWEFDGGHPEAGRRVAVMTAMTISGSGCVDEHVVVRELPLGRELEWRAKDVAGLHLVSEAYGHLYTDATAAVVVGRDSVVEAPSNGKAARGFDAILTADRLTPFAPPTTREERSDRHRWPGAEWAWDAAAGARGEWRRLGEAGGVVLCDVTSLDGLRDAIPEEFQLPGRTFAGCVEAMAEALAEARRGRVVAQAPSGTATKDQRRANEASDKAMTLHDANRDLQARLWQMQERAERAEREVAALRGRR